MNDDYEFQYLDNKYKYDFKSEASKIHKILQNIEFINIYGVEYIGTYDLFLYYKTIYNSTYTKIFFLKNMTELQRFLNYENTSINYQGLYLLGTNNSDIANFLHLNVKAKHKLILMTNNKYANISGIGYFNLHYNSNIKLFNYYIHRIFYSLRPWRSLKINQNTLLDLFNTACTKNPYEFHNYLFNLISLFSENEYNEFIFSNCIKDNLNKTIPNIPQNTKIIVSEINDQILYKISQNPNLLHELSSYNFERIVAKMFEKRGFSVRITPQTRDGGKDIFIAKNDLCSFLFYVECKKYAPNRPVGIEIIQRLYGVISAEKATGGIIATTSYFTEPAKKYIREYNLEHQIALQDFNVLSRILKTL